MRVLIVDDERFFRELYTGHLEGDDVWTVETAGSADEALARFEKGGVDLVVTDLVMPGTDGLALVAALRDREPDLPIVVVTQREDVRPAAEALRLGVDEYLLKPVDRDTLRVSLERAAEARRLKRENQRLEAQHLEHLRSEKVYRACLGLLGDLDVEHLQERLLGTFGHLTGAQGAALWVAGDGGAFAFRGALGLLDPEAVPSSLDLDAGRPLGERLRAHAPFVDEGRSLYVPLVADGALIGVAMVADKVDGDFTAADGALARTVGDFAAVALRNAARVAGLQRVGLRDRETSAYNITYFIDYAGKEIYKARRYGRTFSLVSIQVDNLGLLQRALPDSTRTIHRALIGAVQKVIRDSDILAKVTDDTFYLLLPETDYFGALMFTRRALSAFSASPVVGELSLPPSIAVGAATYPKDGDDFDELLLHCRRRQEEVRRSPYRRLHLEDQPFWDLFDTLLATRAKSALGGTAGRRAHLSEPLFETVLRGTARALQRDPSARGLIYYGAAAIDPGLPLLAELDPTREGAARIYLIGRTVEGGLDHPSVTAVTLPEDGRFDGRRFFLYLTEHAAYAWLEDREDAVYHSSDAALVEALVSRLQEAYDLQRQY